MSFTAHYFHFIGHLSRRVSLNTMNIDLCCSKNVQKGFRVNSLEVTPSDCLDRCTQILYKRKRWWWRCIVKSGRCLVHFDDTQEEKSCVKKEKKMRTKMTWFDGHKKEEEGSSYQNHNKSVSPLFFCYKVGSILKSVVVSLGTRMKRTGRSTWLHHQIHHSMTLHEHSCCCSSWTF
jgi:hypothetical protein